MKKGVEYPVERYKQYQAEDFSIFREITGLVVTPQADAGA